MIEKWLNTIRQGDCLELMKQLPDKCIDLVLTDPPYGIGQDKDQERKSGYKGKRQLGVRKGYGFSNWDNEVPNKEYFEQMMRISKNQIFFGGNYFAHLIPPSSCWIVWDKDNGANDFADCELAWTSFDTAIRKFKWKWHGMLQEQMGKHKEFRQHPTQKPVKLFEWILSKYSKETDIILDPYAGSGTTGRAAKNLGRPFILFEKEPSYCEIANKRLEQEVLLWP